MPRRTNPVGESHRTANIHAPHRQWDDPGTWLWATPDQPARVVFRDLWRDYWERGGPPR